MTEGLGNKMLVFESCLELLPTVGYLDCEGIPLASVLFFMYNLGRQHCFCEVIVRIMWEGAVQRTGRSLVSYVAFTVVKIISS